MPPRDFREVLREAASAHQKEIAVEAIGGDFETAKSELSKYLRGERGKTLWRVIETVFAYGDRDLLRTWLEERLAPRRPEKALEEIGEQLSLLTYRFEEATRVLREREQVIPLERYRKGR